MACRYADKDREKVSLTTDLLCKRGNYPEKNFLRPQPWQYMSIPQTILWGKKSSASYLKFAELSPQPNNCKGTVAPTAIPTPMWIDMAILEFPGLYVQEGDAIP